MNQCDTNTKCQLDTTCEWYLNCIEVEEEERENENE